jgi:hypothetical protein
VSAALQEATVQQQCKQLHLPAVAAQCVRLAEQAVRERQTHLGYLEALLGSELEERERRTIRAHIIETGSESYRFRGTLEKRKKKS